MLAGFAKECDFTHTTSSPFFPQSNGQVERTIKTVKKLLKESEDPQMALFAYRSTPFPWCKLSPAELLMGRRLRANVPLLKDHIVPDWTFLKEFRKQNEDFKRRQKQDYDKSHGVQPRTISSPT